MTSPYLFPSPRREGQATQGRAWVQKVYMPALVKAKIDDVNWHTLRHTFASRLVMGGVHIRSVAELLGHTKIKTTMRSAHLSPAHLSDAVNRVRLGELAISSVTGSKTGNKGTHTLRKEALYSAEIDDIKEKKLEAASGFEPLNRSFADCSLNRLGTPP